MIESTGHFVTGPAAAKARIAPAMGAKEGDHLRPRQGGGHHHRDGRSTTTSTTPPTTRSSPTPPAPTNCVAPMAKVLLDNFGIVKGLDDLDGARLHPGPDAAGRPCTRTPARRAPAPPRRTSCPPPPGCRKGHQPGDPRSSRASSTATFAARPDRHHRIHLPTWSWSSGREVTKDEVNAAYRRPPPRASSLKDVLVYTEDEIVSSDIVLGLARVLHLRRVDHHGVRQPGRGLRLVRQRVGLLQPASSTLTALVASRLYGSCPGMKSIDDIEVAGRRVLLQGAT